MHSKDIVVGKTYAIRFHDGLLTPVTILVAQTGYDGRLRYTARNEKTGRSIIIKSAAKLRFEAIRTDKGWKHAEEGGNK